MDKLRLLINNDLVYYAVIVILIIIAINIFSKFIDNIVLLFKNFRIILFYLKLAFIKSIKFLLKAVFFPFSFYKCFKEYRLYNSLNLNRSCDKDV